MKQRGTPVKNHISNRHLRARMILAVLLLICTATFSVANQALATEQTGEEASAGYSDSAEYADGEEGATTEESVRTDTTEEEKEDTGASHSADNTQNASSATGAGSGEISLVNHFDSEDICVLVRHDLLRKTLTFRNHDLGKNYTLLYDDTTYILDNQSRAISLEEFEPGDLVKVTFLKSNRVINSLSKMVDSKGVVSDSDVFCMTDIGEYKLPVSVAGSARVDKQAILRGKSYVMDYRTLVIADGKVTSPASLMEGDLITVYGVGDEIYSVRVSKGHGYLRLSSTQIGKNSLVGAWIELDNLLLRKITDDMLLTMTEGEYTLYIVGQGANWSTPVTVTRGKETVIDTSGIEIAEPEKGIVNFITAPKETGIIIDGEDLGTAGSVTLEYGIHTLELYAEGYETQVKYLRVASKEADIRLVLTADGSGTNKSTDESSSDTNTGTTSSSATSGTSSSTTGASSTDTSAADTSNTGTGAGTGTSSASADSSQAASSGTGASNSSGSSNTSSQSANTGASWTSPTGSGVKAGVKIENQWIHVEAPTGAKLYVDGTYIGEIPAVFEKVTGIHTVNIRRDGYKIISYNIEVDDAKSDLYFRFPEMETE